MDRVLNGERLTDLRDILGLSQTALADRLGVKQAFISMVESGARPIPEAFAAEAVREFALPSSFFSISATLRDAAPVTFRKKASASVRDERRIIKKHREAARVFWAASRASGYRLSQLPNPGDFDDDIVLLAEAVRGLGGVTANGPIPNVTRLIERLGVGVLACLESGSAGEKDHVSMSRPADARARPLIAMIAACSGDRARLSLAHELGHLIFDQNRAKPISSTRSPEEKRAYDFASALLVPDPVMRANVSESLTLHGYLPLKAKYGVSVAATSTASITARRHRRISSRPAGWPRRAATPPWSSRATSWSTPSSTPCGTTPSSSRRATR